MITLTREEAQKLLDGFERVGWARTEHADILRARLSQPESEPVAWTVGGLITDFSRDFSAYKTKTYTRPLYTAPPQREWQGLTDEEYEAMAEQYVTNYYFDTLKYARAVEAKLKEKNT